MSKFFEPMNLRCDPEKSFVVSYVSEDDSQQERPKTGHILALSVNGTELQADTKVWNPVDSKLEHVVANVDFIQWHGDPTDPMTFYFRVSPKNRALMREALMHSDEQKMFAIKWLVYEFDYDANILFRCFYTGNKPVALTLWRDEKIHIEDRPESFSDFRGNRSPLAFQVNCTLTPPNESDEQNVFFAFSATGQTFSKKITAGCSQQQVVEDAAPF